MENTSYGPLKVCCPCDVSDVLDTPPQAAFASHSGMLITSVLENSKIVGNTHAKEEHL